VKRPGERHTATEKIHFIVKGMGVNWNSIENENQPSPPPSYVVDQKPTHASQRK